MSTEKARYEGEAFLIDGTEYTVPALKTSDFRKFYAVLTDGNVTNETLVPRIGDYLTVAAAALQRNYPTLTEDFLAENLEPMQLFALVKIITSRSGLRPAKQGE